MIAFKDFLPKQTAPGGFMRTPSYQSIDQTVIEANQWVAVNQIAVINVETILFPNLRQSTGSAVYGTSGEVRSLWYQIVRVWYDSK